MGKKVISARGVAVDFDQLQIKQQLSQVPVTTEVKAREQLVERRLRRRAKTLLQNEASEQIEQPTPMFDNDSTEVKTRKQQRNKE